MFRGVTSEHSLAWQHIAAWLGEGPPPNEPAPYGAIAEVAYRNRLEPLLGASELPSTLPSALAHRFREATQATRAAQIARFPAVREVLDVLHRWPVILFKGFAAAELLYPDVGARSMGDVDLLVRPPDFEAARDALLSAGFQQAFTGDPVLDHPTHHERELTNGALVVDLHQGFTQAYRVPVDYAALFERSLPWFAFAPNARVLSPEDAVLAQVIHLAVGELTPQAAPVIGVWDLRLMFGLRAPFWALGGPVLDLDRLDALASDSGAARMLYAVLAFSSRLFPSLAPAFRMQGGQVSTGVRATLDRLARRALPPHNPSRLEMLWRKAVLLPPPARRALLFRQLPLQLRYWVGKFLGRYE
jgi:hypothetical protein